MRLIPCVIFSASLGYYYLLSSKIFTWVYTSGDAGDWLSLLHWWYIPHTFGKPLIILLSRFVGLFPGDDVIKLTVALAVIPAAVTVTLVYFIVKHLTGSAHLGVIASLVLLGATVFTTQATVLEQYAFTAMFVTAAFYAHVKDRKGWTLAFLGLTTATHVIGVPFLIIWIVANRHEWKEYLRLSYIYILTGILPYGLLLVMMADPGIPKLVAGGLSMESILDYCFGNRTLYGSLAIVEAPYRLLEMGAIMLVTFGVAFVPFVKGLKPWDARTKVIIGTAGFVAWFWLTTLFPSVWKWMAFVIPIMTVCVAIGLTKLPKWHTVLVVVCALSLVGVNAVHMNTNTLAHEEPLAVETYERLRTLPDGAAVLSSRGGAYGFTLFYVISEGKDLIPLMQANPYTMTEEGQGLSQSYMDYLDWLEQEYGIVGDDMFEIVQYALDNGYEVYYGMPLTPLWDHICTVESDKMPARVLDINHDPDLSSEASWRWDD